MEPIRPFGGPAQTLAPPPGDPPNAARGRLRNIFAVLPHWRRITVDVVVLLIVLVIFRLVAWGIDSYRHFTWQNLRDDRGVTYAIPAWRK